MASQENKMDLKQFDSTLKSALDNLQVPYEPGTWSALEQKLDRLPAPDAVDKAVRPALEHIESTFDAGSWALLANRMDSLVRVRRLRATKVAEAAILLLLLMNLKGFFGVVESVTHPVPVPKALPGPIAKAHTSKSKNHKSLSNPAAAALNNNQDQSFTEKILVFVQDVAANLLPEAAAEPVPMVALNTTSFDSKSSLLDPARFYSQSGLMKFPADMIVPGQNIEPLQYANAIPTVPGLNNIIPIDKKAKTTGLYAASFAAFDNNHAIEADFANRTKGYSGGFAVGYRKGKWGVETGLAYAQKNYTPKRANVEYQNDPFNGISFYYIDEVDADVFSVPVKATRRIAKIGTTSAHAVAGVTGHFASSKRYGYKTVHYPPPFPQPNPDPTPQTLASFPKGQGILENGGTQHNAYVSADLGLRFEQAVGRRYVAFVEPVYRHSMRGGLGPNTARINTFSVQAGVMASL